MNNLATLLLGPMPNGSCDAGGRIWESAEVRKKLSKKCQKNRQK
jgi:hypothetical protein